MANRSIGSARSGRSSSHQRPSVSGLDVRAGALEPALRDLPQVRQEAQVQVIRGRDTEGDRAFDLLDLAGRSIAVGPLDEGFVERRAAVPRERIAERRDDCEHDECSDDQHVRVDRHTSDSGLGDCEIDAGDGREGEQDDEVEQMPSHAGAPARPSRISRSAPIASCFIPPLISLLLNFACWRASSGG